MSDYHHDGADPNNDVEISTSAADPYVETQVVQADIHVDGSAVTDVDDIAFASAESSSEHADQQQQQDQEAAEEHQHPPPSADDAAVEAVPDAQSQFVEVDATHEASADEAAVVVVEQSEEEVAPEHTDLPTATGSPIPDVVDGSAAAIVAADDVDVVAEAMATNLPASPSAGGAAGIETGSSPSATPEDGVVQVVAESTNHETAAGPDTSPLGEPERSDATQEQEVVNGAADVPPSSSSGSAIAASADNEMSSRPKTPTAQRPSSVEPSVQKDASTEPTAHQPTGVEGQLRSIDDKAEQPIVKLVLVTPDIVVTGPTSVEGDSSEDDDDDDDGEPVEHLVEFDKQGLRGTAEQPSTAARMMSRCSSSFAAFMLIVMIVVLFALLANALVYVENDERQIVTLTVNATGECSQLSVLKIAFYLANCFFDIIIFVLCMAYLMMNIYCKDRCNAFVSLARVWAIILSLFFYFSCVGAVVLSARKLLDQSEHSDHIYFYKLLLLAGIVGLIQATTLFAIGMSAIFRYRELVLDDSRYQRLDDDKQTGAHDDAPWIPQVCCRARQQQQQQQQQQPGQSTSASAASAASTAIVDESSDRRVSAKENPMRQHPTVDVACARS